MRKKNISCVITTHNRDEYLKDAIYSIIKQTYSPLEILISNNIPNKKTQKIIKTISKKTQVPINYLEHNMRGRGAASANLAASKAKGDYIAFLDDDDMWDKNYLKEIAFFISQKKSKIVYSWFYKIQNNKKTSYKKLDEKLKINDFILSNPGSGVSNLVVDKNIFISLGGFDDYINPSYDKDFIIRAIHYGYKYYVLKKKLVIQRKHTQQLSDINKSSLLGMKKFFNKHKWSLGTVLKIKFWIKYWKKYIRMLKFYYLK
ncbi:glycosyltransferase family 2 protein [Candidatus Pelagibacter sp. HIMB1495]|uniref:glycosyltransferase family 2 protein n=1 Tax=unclassified Candidatus Pelagibacter TaxID=2647897 RepID=UPI003F858133